MMPTRAERLGNLLASVGCIRVPLDRVLDCWGEAAPELHSHLERLASLSSALEELALAGVIELPAAGSWDRSTRPPLPKFVTVVSARRPRRAETWRRHPWRPELGWVSSLSSLSEPHLEALLALDDWLGRAEEAGGKEVPARLRSAEIFGDEKLLDRLLSSRLFGPGRLSLEVLGARRHPPPLTIRRVGSGPDLLIVENADPFWACVATLGEGAIGRVAWGAGHSCTSSVTALHLEEEPVERIWYWGDLDPKGVRIGTEVARAAEAARLARVVPAQDLWLAMAALPPTGEGRHSWRGVPSAWLGSEVWEKVALVRSVAGRVAQERLAVDEVEKALAAID